MGAVATYFGNIVGNFLKGAAVAHCVSHVGFSYVATTDAHLVALDARSGAVRWDSEIADEAMGYSNTSGPIVADGIVINGKRLWTLF